MLVIKNKNQLQLLVLLLELVFIIFFRKTLFSSLQTSGIWELLISSLLLLVVFPWLTLKAVFHQEIAQYNFSWKKGHWKKNIGLNLFLFAGIAIVMLKLEWLKIFPVSAWILANPGLVIFIDLIILPLIVLANEFFFRGVFLETLRKSSNVAWAIILQALGSAFYLTFLGAGLSWNKFAFFLGLGLLSGIVAHWNRSFFFSALTHWLVLVSIDFITLYRFV